MAVNVVLKSVWDDKGIKNAQKAIQDFNSGFDRAFKAVGVAAAAAGAAVALFAKQSITAASSLEESTNAVNVAFGQASESILKIGEDSAKSFGLARTEFNQAAVRFSAFAERVVGQGGDVSGFIRDITQRAADFASVFNIEVAEALRVFQSGLSGEAEPLKRFGINLLESEVKAYALRTGLISVGETMTEQQKVQARYGLLLESTNKTAGDFANTSDSLANQQRILTATFTDLQAEIGTALLPVVGQLVKQFADFLLPKLQELGDWINSPDGKKAVNDFGTAIGNVLKSAFDFGDWFVKNFDTIKDFFVAIGIGLITMRALTGAIQIATAAMALFNGVSAANIFIAAAAAIALIASGMYLVYQNTKKTNDALEEQRIAILKTEEAWVTSATNGASAYKGLIPGLEYSTSAVSDLGKQGLVAADHIRDLNNIKLQGLRNEINGTTGELNRFRNLSNKFVAAFKPIEEGGGGGGGGGLGASVESAFEKVQKFIKSAQKDLANAQEQYNKTIATAQKRYSEAVLKTEKDFANRLADIVQQSQNRLRTAFESVVRVSLTDIFEVEETKSVANLVAGLTTRLSKSQALLEKAGKLNAAGFSQTFIEQVVQAGTDTGNELASAILESTPQTQAELQRLFLALETTAETGMDSLAREIYQKQDLATRELKNLYARTQTELDEALKQLQLDFNQEVIDANQTLIEAVKKIREAFKENIESMKGDLGGLDKVVTDFLAKLTKVETAAKTQIPVAPSTGGGGGGAVGGGMTGIDVAISTLSNVSGYFIDSITDIAKLISYLNERITAANKFANEAAIAGRTTEAMSAVGIRNELQSQLSILQSLRTMGGAAVGTTININVKTDPSQSLAMVGKTLGNTITKYVTAGGQVLVSPTN